MTNLPQELIDRIVDNLHDDRPNLLATSLVHRAMRSASLYHLLETSAIDVRDDTISSLCKLLKGSPAFATYVHTLCLHGTIHQYLEPEHLECLLVFAAATTLQLRTTRLSSASLLQSLLTGLPGVRNLVIKGWISYKSSDWSENRLERLPLRTLVLEQSYPLVVRTSSIDFSTQRDCDTTY